MALPPLKFGSGKEAFLELVLPRSFFVANGIEFGPKE